jgi:hypothetical protein
MIRARYSIAIQDASIVTLVGSGEGKSITNDAENVIEDLCRLGFFELCPRFRVIYLDTSGVWDELLVHDGKFAGFQPIGLCDRAEAIEWVKQHPHLSPP